MYMLRCHNSNMEIAVDCPPVLFLIFNRPDVTQLVFQKIREAQPKQLFVAADGPRSEHPNDGLLCEATRRIIEQVDWPCEVKTSPPKPGMPRGS